MILYPAHDESLLLHVFPYRRWEKLLTERKKGKEQGKVKKGRKKVKNHKNPTCAACYRLIFWKEFASLAENKIAQAMKKENSATYKKKPRQVKHCLECGEVIAYGRSDKKFCSSRCKNRYNNERFRDFRIVCGRVETMLRSNHSVLEKLLDLKLDGMSLSELSVMGFNRDVFTTCRKVGVHQEYGCYDLRYYMTANRIFNLHRTVDGREEKKGCAAC